MQAAGEGLTALASKEDWADRVSVSLLRMNLQHALGNRGEAVKIGYEVLRLIGAGHVPEWPCILLPIEDYPEFAQCSDNWQELVILCIREFLLRNASFSTYFSKDAENLKILLASGKASLRTIRSALLVAMRQSAEVRVTPNLALFEDSKSLNSRIWIDLCYGAVPPGARGIAEDVKVVDVGAAALAPRSEPYAGLVLLECAHVTAFEGNPEEASRLERLLGHSQRHQVVNRFVGDGREATFNRLSWNLTSGLFAPNTQLLRRYEGLERLVKPLDDMKVDTIRLDSMFTPKSIDFLKMD